jgi:ABC-type branched-subunit amino acid transport system substrate-binding protein
VEIGRAREFVRATVLYNSDYRLMFLTDRKEVVMKKLLIAAAVLLLLTGLATGVGAAEIKIGTLLSHTGPLKEFGPNIQNGAVLAAKQMGAAGFEIEMIHEDS